MIGSIPSLPATTPHSLSSAAWASNQLAGLNPNLMSGYCNAAPLLNKEATGLYDNLSSVQPIAILHRHNIRHCSLHRLAPAQSIESGKSSLTQTVTQFQ